MTTIIHTPISGNLKRLHQYDTHPIGLYGMRQNGSQLIVQRSPDGIRSATVRILESDYINSFLTFSDKESYLKWVADWKAIYKALSDESRKYKRLRKKANAEAAGIDQSMATVKVFQLRLELYYLLQIRMAGKGKSHSLWLKSQS